MQNENCMTSCSKVIKDFKIVSAELSTRCRPFVCMGPRVTALLTVSQYTPAARGREQSWNTSARPWGNAWTFTPSGENKASRYSHFSSGRICYQMSLLLTYKNWQFSEVLEFGIPENGLRCYSPTPWVFNVIENPKAKGNWGWGLFWGTVVVRLLFRLLQ